MSFSIQWLDSNGELHTTEWNSGNYPIDQSRTSPELGSIGVPSNAIAVTPYVHAYWGTLRTERRMYNTSQVRPTWRPIMRRVRRSTSTLIWCSSRRCVVTGGEQLE